MRARSFSSVLVLIAPMAMAAGASLVTLTPPRTYQPPVVAPVPDPFRQPAGPYSAGNRGLDYATAPGTAVGAIADGIVVFAGTVANRLYVTVLHLDGLRSSYSYLASIAVTLGQSVVAGQRLGAATDHLQLGVRRGDTYLDPALLFARRRPHLVRPPRGERTPSAR